jgi:S1-C subfamily serine protease
MHQKRIFILFFMVLLGCAANSCADKKPADEAVLASLEPEERKRIAVFETVSPSVVFIKNSSLQWDIFSLDVYAIPTGAGSGFVWDKRGHIITNFHVVYGSDRIEVAFADQKSYEAKVVGISPDHDLAVLKINAPAAELTPIALGSSDNLLIGQKTMVIGNPFGLDHSLSTGVVSALGRSISALTGRKIGNMIQTDAPINPGNSGGPLLDSSGKLIGVTAAIFSPSGAYAGVGFAIPVDTVKRIVPQLIEFGRVKRLGIGVTLVPDAIREHIGLSGALVLEIIPESPAELAGLQGTRRNFLGSVLLGDLIITIDGKKVETNDDLLTIAEENHQAGDKVVIEFVRDGVVRKETIPLKEM